MSAAEKSSKAQGQSQAGQKAETTPEKAGKMSTLTKLEELKIEYRDLFRAAAPKVKRVDEACFYLRCPTVLNPKHFKFTWRGLRVAKQTCTRKTCPRTLLIRYLEMLDHTRSFRQCNDDAESRAFWRGVVSEWKGRLWIALGRRQ